MAASDSLNSDLFSIVKQAVPLEYSKWPRQGMTRFAVVDPTAPEPLKGDTYFAERQKKNWYGASGRRLKTPKIEVTPGAEPGVISFADTHPLPDEGIYIDYMKTRSDMRGRGHGRRIVQHIAEQTPGLIHFGKVMSPSVWGMMEDLKKQGRNVQGHRDF